MVRDIDFNWQFWRSCYCALDRELNLLIEFKPTVVNCEFSILLTMNKTDIDNNRIIKERIFQRYYKLESTKINIPSEYKPWLEKFMEDYFEAKEMGRLLRT